MGNKTYPMPFLIAVFVVYMILLSAVIRIIIKNMPDGSSETGKSHDAGRIFDDDCRAFCKKIGLSYADSTTTTLNYSGSAANINASWSAFVCWCGEDDNNG